MLFDLTVSLLLISLSANIALAIYIKKKPKTVVQVTEDARSILRDLATGPALLRVEYIDRADIFLRSPRDQR